jgi:hypothetical protein
MGRVRCVKPKGDAVSTTKTVRRKVVKKSEVSGLRRSAKRGIGGCRIMPQ